jgi:hypothetical protein
MVAKIVGQVQASDMDSQPKRWAKARNLGAKPVELTVTTGRRSSCTLAGRLERTRDDLRLDWARDDLRRPALRISPALIMHGRFAN